MLTLQAKNKNKKKIYIYSNDKVVNLPQLDFAVTKKKRERERSYTPRILS